jgi:CheY-like chemotaxis protein
LVYPLSQIGSLPMPSSSRHEVPVPRNRKSTCPRVIEQEGRSNLLGARTARAEHDVSVFIVEDNAPTRRGLERMLEVFFRVKSFASADEMLEAVPLSVTSGAVVVLDLALPGAPGIELLKRIRAETREAKVLIFTMAWEQWQVLRAAR